MSYIMNDLHHLAARAGTGDAGATAALRQELQSQMLRIVRRAMRGTAGTSALTQRIRAAIQRLAPENPALSAADPEKLVRRVAHDLCDSLIGRLQAEQPARHPVRETVRT